MTYENQKQIQTTANCNPSQTSSPAEPSSIHQQAYNACESSDRIRAVAENLRDELLQNEAMDMAPSALSPSTIDGMLREANDNSSRTIDALASIRQYLLG